MVLVVKGTTNRRYAMHGDGLETIEVGLNAIRMSRSAQPSARGIVREVLQANHVQSFRWYKTNGTSTLSCYWDDQPSNCLWINRNEIHVRSDERRVRLPERPINWERKGGTFVGWTITPASRRLLAAHGSSVATVLCPEEFVQVPVGTPCPYCDLVHPTPVPN